MKFKINDIVSITLPPNSQFNNCACKITDINLGEKKYTVTLINPAFDCNHLTGYTVDESYLRLCGNCPEYLHEKSQ